MEGGDLSHKWIGATYLPGFCHILPGPDTVFIVLVWMAIQVSRDVTETRRLMEQRETLRHWRPRDLQKEFYEDFFSRFSICDGVPVTLSDLDTVFIVLVWMANQAFKRNGAKTETLR